MSKENNLETQPTQPKATKPKAVKVDPIREKVLDMAAQFNVNQIASMLAIPSQDVKKYIDDYNKES